MCGHVSVTLPDSSVWSCARLTQLETWSVFSACSASLRWAPPECVTAASPVGLSRSPSLRNTPLHLSGKNLGVNLGSSPHKVPLLQEIRGVPGGHPGMGRTPEAGIPGAAWTRFSGDALPLYLMLLPEVLPDTKRGEAGKWGGAGSWEAVFLKSCPSVISEQFIAGCLGLSQSGRLKAWPHSFYELLPRIQDEISTETVSQHLDPFRAIRQSFYVS